MLRIIICDDDEKFLSETKEKVEGILVSLGEEAVIHGFTARESIGSHTLSGCDIALLDVDFCGKPYNGIDIAKELRALRRDTVIIFLTNFIEYAPVGYELQAFRYILKKQVTPYLDICLPQAIAHLKETNETVKVQVNGEIIDLVVENILYIEVHQHSAEIYLEPDRPSEQMRVCRVNSSLSNLEKNLDPLGFLRIHKSFLVNMRHIKIFNCRKCVLKNGTELRVSEKKYNERKKAYLEWRGVS